MIRKCPQCSKLFNYETTNQLRPFCSERCRLIDLGNWLSEKNRLQGEELSDNDINISETKH